MAGLKAAQGAELVVVVLCRSSDREGPLSAATLIDRGPQLSAGSGCLWSAALDMST